MDNVEVKKLRLFLDELATYHFLLHQIGIYDCKGALDFIASYQDEEQIFEHFIAGLISQSEFFPIDPNKWIQMAKLCNYDHPAIMDNRIELLEGGPVSDWYIYPKLLKWLLSSMPDTTKLYLSDRDQAFLDFEVPH